MWRAIYSEPGGKARALIEISELGPAAASERGTLWLDLLQAAPDEVAILSDVFQLDPLAVEDCVSEVHHPKVDDYGEYLYLAAHGIKADAKRGEIETLELDVVLSKRWLVTYRAAEMRSVNEAWERCMRQEGFLGKGPDDVLQAILSSQAVHYVDEVERLQEDVLAVEGKLFGAAAPRFMERLFNAKSDMARLRRILGAQRELLHRLSRGEYKLIGAKLLMHYRDVYDDLYRATEMLDMLRDIAMAVMETHLAFVANRTNEIMKVLTTIATFILPLTLITGWYGMNFEHLMGRKWLYGELYVLGLFAVVIGGLWIYLRRKRWL